MHEGQSTSGSMGYYVDLSSDMVQSPLREVLNLLLNVTDHHPCTCPNFLFLCNGLNHL